jgi:hypothetical protein
MKSFLGKLGVILFTIFFFVVGCQTPVKKDEYSNGADWKYFASAESFFVYYDTQTITRLSKNIVRVWVRYSFTSKGALYYMLNHGEEYKNFSYSIYLMEIDCVEKTHRALSRTEYDNKGIAISSTTNFPLEGQVIPPESVFELLYKAVCK